MVTIYRIEWLQYEHFFLNVSVYPKMSVRNAVLRRQARKIIHNVVNYMQKEKDEGVHNVAQVQRRAAEATGVSIRTVSNILREAKKGDTNSDFRTPGKNRNKPSPITGIDDFDKGVIKRCIYSFHVKEKAMPSITRLLAKLQREIKFKGSASSLSRIIKDLGFKRRKTENNKLVFIERTDIRLKRIQYLKQIKKYRDEGKKIVYTAETSVYPSHPKGVERSDDIDKSLKGQKVVAVHAGSEDGFVTNGLFMFKAGIKSDIDNMNFFKYEKWLRTQLIPSLSPNSVVVIDNAPYHNKLRDPVPTSNARKEDMESWLTEKGISYEKNMLKPELYQLICQNKSSHKDFMIDHIFAEHNHIVLRLPPHHPDLSPIEMAWADVKSYVVNKNINFDVDQAIQLIEEKVSLMGQAEWLTMCKHVKKIEDEYIASDHIVDNMTESLIIDTDDSSESEYESEEDNFEVNGSDSCETEDPVSSTDNKPSLSIESDTTHPIIQPMGVQLNNNKKEKVHIYKVQRCCYKGCGSTWSPGTSLVFHAFPNEATRREQWLTAAGFENENNKTARLCSLHFRPSDYNGKQLLPTAVPISHDGAETSILSTSAEETTSENAHDELFEIKQECDLDIKEEPCFEVPITNGDTSAGDDWGNSSDCTQKVQNNPLRDHLYGVASSSVPVVPLPRPVSEPEDGQPPTKRLNKGPNYIVILRGPRGFPITRATK